MRLIDADKLQHDMYDAAFIQDSALQKWDGGCWIRYRMFEKTLGKQDEAIVRCRECKNSYVDERTLVCGLRGFFVHEDFFCADGERREDGKH